MLTHPTCNRLVALGLTGMAKAFDEQPAAARHRRARLRRTVRAAGRPRGDRTREQAIGEPPALRRAAAERRRRGYRHEGTARPRQGAVPEAGRRRVDRAAPEFADRRANRRRQKLDCLCARPQGLPRQSLGHLSAAAAIIRRARARPRRRTACPAPQIARARRSAHSRRLGASADARRAAPRLVGDHGGPPRPQLDHS